MVTAMPDKIPKALINQLKPNGKMIIPVNEQLVLVTKAGDSYTEQKLIGVRFVPLINSYCSTG